MCAQSGRFHPGQDIARSRYYPDSAGTACRACKRRTENWMFHRGRVVLWHDIGNVEDKEIPLRVTDRKQSHMNQVSRFSGFQELPTGSGFNDPFLGFRNQRIRKTNSGFSEPIHRFNLLSPKCCGFRNSYSVGNKVNSCAHTCARCGFTA